MFPSVITTSFAEGAVSWARYRSHVAADWDAAQQAHRSGNPRIVRYRLVSWYPALTSSVSVGSRHRPELTRPAASSAAG